MEYKYYRELKHNYLVAKRPDLDRSKCDSYQVRIIKNGNLKGFVPCDIRNINNEQFLYYEINSLQSVKDRFSSKKMTSEQLIGLFSSLKAALEELSECLLGIENIILDSGSVFTDLVTGQFYFLYSPFQDKGPTFASFVDELFDLVDHDDETAVEMVYACSESAQIEGVLVLDLIKQMIGGIKKVEGKEAGTCTDELGKSSEDFTYREYDEDYFDEDTVSMESSINKGRKTKRDISGKAQILFSFMFFALLVSMVFIRMNFILSDEENLLSIIVMLVSAVTGIVAFLSGIRDFTSGKNYFEKGDTEEVSGETRESSEDVSEYSQVDGTWDGIFELEDNIDMDIFRKPISVSSGLKGGDETVVLNMDDTDDREFTLYSRNTDKTLRIVLNKLPLTVGKLEGCVDNVVSDKSISRIHCRFSRNEEGRIVLTDLNSTNGTYRNGLKLRAQEDTCIEEGDEVRIGRICFDCR